ncbi:type II toxin-antitoxin system ParD family antitoxin [Magnetovirga frankeli]|nr:type II toxin-antitoxin system ParD family antitoxin [gamma proteobacterium SS-5]
MPTSVALSPHFEAFIRQPLDSGRFNNVSEVIRNLAALKTEMQSSTNSLFAI